MIVSLADLLHPIDTAALVSILSALIALASASFTLLSARAAHLDVRHQMLRYTIDLAEKTRAERGILREWNANLGQPMPESVRVACDRVARAFDIIAFLDRTRAIDRQFVDSFYSGTFIDLWESVLREYVAEVQRQRSPRHLWELAHFYNRIKYVNDWHPAANGKNTWPKNPRKVHWRRYVSKFKIDISNR